MKSSNFLKTESIELIIEKNVRWLSHLLIRSRARYEDNEKLSGELIFSYLFCVV